MTDLRKTIHRRTVEPVQAVRRRVVVSLGVGDTIIMREEGRRKEYVAPISRVFVQMVRWNSDVEVAQRKAERKAKRIARQEGVSI